MYAVMDGEKIRAMREERELSRQELAREAGVAPSTLRSVERGDRVRALQAGGSRWSLACIRAR